MSRGCECANRSLRKQAQSFNLIHVDFYTWIHCCSNLGDSLRGSSPFRAASKVSHARTREWVTLALAPPFVYHSRVSIHHHCHHQIKSSFAGYTEEGFVLVWFFVCLFFVGLVCFVLFFVA